MSSDNNTLKAILYDEVSLKILDQLKLPTETEYIDVGNCEDAWKVIRNMNVRGAPAIAIVASLGLTMELKSDLKKQQLPKDMDSFRKHLGERLQYLNTSRPTAVNLARAIRDIQNMLDTSENISSVADAVNEIGRFAKDLLLSDLDINQNLSKYGAEHILRNVAEGDNVRILTHCNTGSLATGGYGTALGVIRELFKLGRLAKAYCTETRPYNQGSRLTAYELVTDRIPCGYICDSAAAALMKEMRITAVVVGADRVARNGDTANKIGTLALAISASYYNIPFYVACPTNTIDGVAKTGQDIPIELRSPEEMAFRVNGKRVPPEGIDGWNPAFDVTPAKLITGGIITEHGVVIPPLDSVESSKVLGLN